MENRLKEIRKARKITGVSIADKLNISLTHYYDLEAGRRRLNDEFLTQVADILECSIDDIFGRSSRDEAKDILNHTTILLAKEIQEMQLDPDQVRNILKIYVAGLKQGRQKTEESDPRDQSNEP
jgi:transcriptional regulator with XRE-family HTH domain